jgi:hypothetical protein
MEITAKFGNMRKAQQFTVYPRPTNVGDDYNLLMIQSDTRICRFDKTTGDGVLSAHKSNGAYGAHLALPDAMRVKVPQDVIAACIAAQPQKGDRLCWRCLNNWMKAGTICQFTVTLLSTSMRKKERFTKWLSPKMMQMI